MVNALRKLLITPYARIYHNVNMFIVLYISCLFPVQRERSNHLNINLCERVAQFQLNPKQQKEKNQILSMCNLILNHPHSSLFRESGRTRNCTTKTTRLFAWLPTCPIDVHSRRVHQWNMQNKTTCYRITLNLRLLQLSIINKRVHCLFSCKIKQQR